MLRIALFLLTNMAVIAIFAVVSMMLSAIFGIRLGTGSMTGLLVMCFVYGTLGSMVSLFLSKFMAKKSTGTRVISQPSTSTEQWLIHTVQKQAQEVGIAMPEVGIFNSPQPNAFATGWNKNQALVAVSTGLLNTMSQDEIEAVLAHEIGHVANGDMVTLAMIQGIVNSFVMFFARIVGLLIDQVVFRNKSDQPGIGYFISSMVLDMVFGVIATAIVMWFSRLREYRADEMGARLAGKSKMISALQALKPASQQPNTMPMNMQAFAISSGKNTGFSFAQLFSSHPSLDDRIQALQNLPT